MGGNPDEDITNTTYASLYKNYQGKAIRIQAYWTTAIREKGSSLTESLNMIKTADAILKKYTLSLDWTPQPTGAEFPAGLNFDQVLVVPEGKLGSNKDSYAALYKLMAPTEQDRLAVAFTPLSGSGAGKCILEVDWLPWVVVDPSRYTNQKASALLHEIGHACRLGHQQMNIPAQDSQEESDRYRNVMGYKDWGDQLWNWQVDAIYNSAWCAGGPPKNWWTMDPNCLQSPDCAFLW
jgi:hypothetical protein